MTLPIAIVIGDLAASGRLCTREVRFVAPRACRLRLDDLHVERVPRDSADQHASAAILADIDLALFDADAAGDEEAVARLLADRDRVLASVVERAWEPTREYVVEKIVVDDVVAFDAKAPPPPPAGPREQLPIQAAMPCLPGQTIEIVARPLRAAFRPDRFLIGAAGTPGGAGDWVVEDLRIGNRSQLVQVGGIRGDMFATNAIDGFVSFETVQTSMDVTIHARYVGPNEGGCVFHAALIGTVVDMTDGAAIAVGARARVSLVVRNCGAEGSFRAVWLAREVAPSSRPGQEELIEAWRRIVGGHPLPAA